MTPRVPPPLGAPEPPLFSRSSHAERAAYQPRCRSRVRFPSPPPVAVPQRLGDERLVRRAVADVVREHRARPVPRPPPLASPPSLSSRSSRGVTSAPRHARSSRRAARRSARRRACSSSGPSARDDRGAADQGASRALGVAACAAARGYGGGGRRAAPSRHPELPRAPQHVREGHLEVRACTESGASIVSTAQTTNGKSKIPSHEHRNGEVPLFKTSSHTNMSRRAAWEFC